jgi:hypothetical protein
MRGLLASFYQEQIRSVPGFPGSACKTLHPRGKKYRDIGFGETRPKTGRLAPLIFLLNFSHVWRREKSRPFGSPGTAQNGRRAA